jgi:hypothetical protein
MKNFSLIALAVISLALSGCASPMPYGNFIHPSMSVNQQKLAENASKEIIALWPPAKTRLELRQPASDKFGVALVAALRASGYAVQEFEVTQAAEPVKDEAIKVPPQTTTLPLRYILDHDAGLFRLILLVGNQSITRPYLIHEDKLIAAGYWVRKE